MTLVVTHAKVSSIADDPGAAAAGEVLPSHWNANHTLTGPADASQLNSNVVQSVVNDTNIQGSILSQVLTFAWAALLSLARGGTGANLSATGGAGQYLKQTSAGGAVTVAAIAQADLPAVTIRKPASNATIAITSSDVEVGIDTRTTAVSATLPSAAAWATANPFGLELVLEDYYGNAGTNNITPSLFAGDSFAGAWASVTPVISANSGILRLRPDASLPGWVVRGVN